MRAMHTKSGERVGEEEVYTTGSSRNEASEATGMADRQLRRTRSKAKRQRLVEEQAWREQAQESKIQELQAKFAALEKEKELPDPNHVPRPPKPQQSHQAQPWIWMQQQPPQTHAWMWVPKQGWQRRQQGWQRRQQGRRARSH